MKNTQPNVFDKLSRFATFKLEGNVTGAHDLHLYWDALQKSDTQAQAKSRNKLMKSYTDYAHTMGVTSPADEAKQIANHMQNTTWGTKSGDKIENLCRLRYRSVIT